jgi:ABC-type transporter Mla subunit MlaD
VNRSLSADPLNLAVHGRNLSELLTAFDAWRAAQSEGLGALAFAGDQAKERDATVDAIGAQIVPAIVNVAERSADISTLLKHLATVMERLPGKTADDERERARAFKGLMDSTRRVIQTSPQYASLGLPEESINPISHKG